MNDAIDVVGQELLYHVSHKGESNKSTDWEAGFIAALAHIHDLLLKIHSAESAWDEIK